MKAGIVSRKISIETISPRQPTLPQSLNLIRANAAICTDHIESMQQQ
jgi:hypothetical protein